MLVDEFARAVKQESVRRVAHIHGTFEVAVHVEQDVEFPALAFYGRLHLGGGTRVVDGDGINRYTRLILPILIHIIQGIVLLDAGTAPSGPESEDDGIAVVRQFGDVHILAVQVLQSDIRQVGLGLRMKARESQGHQQ